MSALALRRRLRRFARRRSAFFAVALVSASLVAHHGVGVGVAAHMHHDSELGSVVEFCVAVLVAVGGTAVAAMALGGFRPVKWRLSTVVRLPLSLTVGRIPLPKARAGPPLLCLLCVSLR